MQQDWIGFRQLAEPSLPFSLYSLYVKYKPDRINDNEYICSRQRFFCLFDFWPRNVSTRSLYTLHPKAFMQVKYEKWLGKEKGIYGLDKDLTNWIIMTNFWNFSRSLHTLYPMALCGRGMSQTGLRGRNWCQMNR